MLHTASSWYTTDTNNDRGVTADMQNNIGNYAFYAALVLSAGATLYAMGIMPLVNGGHASSHTAQTTESSHHTHDATNSDSHHDTDSEQVSGTVDLTNQSNVQMDIKDFKYGQSDIKIKVGTTVTWTNQDTMEHDVMAEHDHDDEAHDGLSHHEVDGDTFGSALLAKGESYSFTFTQPGVELYHCSPHPYMKGSVTVVE